MRFDRIITEFVALLFWTDHPLLDGLKNKVSSTAQAMTPKVKGTITHREREAPEQFTVCTERGSKN